MTMIGSKHNDPWNLTSLQASVTFLSNSLDITLFNSERQTPYIHSGKNMKVGFGGKTLQKFKI